MATKHDDLKAFRTAACSYCEGTGKQLDHLAIGRLMRGLREKKHLSVREMARRLKLSTAYVSDLELGRRNWTTERVRLYKEVL